MLVFCADGSCNCEICVMVPFDVVYSVLDFKDPLLPIVQNVESFGLEHCFLNHGFLLV